MMAANPKGNAFQKWLTHVEKYSNDVMDNSFKDPTAAKLFTEAMDEYLEFMQRNISYGDPRSADPMVRVLGKIYQVVESTHPNFYEGYSNMLSRFYLDDMMQLVSKANTEPLQRQLVQDLVNNKPIMINNVQRTNVLKEIHAGAKVDKGKVSDFDQIFLKDPEKGFSYDNINIDGVWGWLFNVDSTASYQTALNALMGTGEKGVYIRELLSKGIVEVPMGNNVFKTIRMPRYKNSASIEDTNISMKAFKADLEEAFPVADMPNAQAIWADTKTWTKENESILRQGINTFFTWSSKIENLVNFGPEYRMSYWDHIGRYAPAMNLEDLQQAYKVAEKTLAPIRTRTKAGKYLAIGKNHQTLRILQKEIIKRKKNPDIGSSMTLSDAHATASRMAGEATKALFYDASRTLDATNKARLIFPFLQAHMNTIKSWSKLTAENPIQVYKFGKAFNALTQPGTSAIYDLTHTQYDENDGFFYKDEFNTTRFRYPLLGNILGAFAGKTIDSAQALQLTAPVESLNLAFGSTNPLAPGVGPVAQGAIYAVLIAAVGLISGGVAGPAVLGLFKMADKLLQGERFTSAAYSGAKTGAAAYAVGQLKNQFGGDTPQPAPAPPQDTTFGGGTYTIQQGDQLGYIAQANGVSVEDIRGMNPQIDFSKPLRQGVEITLPNSGPVGQGSVWQGYQGGMYGDKSLKETKKSSVRKN